MVATEDRVRDAIGGLSLGIRRASLLTDDDPGEVFPVELRRAAFWQADDIRRIANAIIRAYPAKFQALSQFRGVFYWQADAGETNGQPNYGAVKLVKGVTRELTRGDGDDQPVDYVMTVSADWVGGLAMTRLQVEALVFRLLCHLLVDEKGRLKLVQPDIVAFRSEIIEYGDWNAELQKARDAFTQLPLWQE